MALWHRSENPCYFHQQRNRETRDAFKRNGLEFKSLNQAVELQLFNPA
jgi:hypothetical protein